MAQRWKFLLVLMLAACTTSIPKPTISGALTLNVPANIIAGQQFVVTVLGDQIPARAKVSLVSLSSVSITRYEAEASAGNASFVLPGRSTQAAGIVILHATLEGAHGSAQVLIEPAAAAGPLPVFVGPRTVIANGSDMSMAVVIPFDQYGNQLPDQTPVRIRVIYPNQRQSDLYTQITDGVGWQRVVGGFDAGRVTINAALAQQRSMEVDLMATAAWPITMALSIDRAQAVADGRTLLTLRTSVIRDQNGNIMADGTLVLFAVAMPDGSQQRIPAYTIGGIAEAPLQAAATPGKASAVVILNSVVSSPQSIQFTAGPVISTFPVVVTLDTTQQILQLQAGPMSGPQEQLVANGTAIVFNIRDSLGVTRQIVSESQNGSAYAQIDLKSLAPGTGQVVVVVGTGSGSAEFIVP